MNEPEWLSRPWERDDDISAIGLLAGVALLVIALLVLFAAGLFATFGVI